MMNSGSLRFRLTVWYAGVLAGILVLFSIATYLGVSHFLGRNLHESLVKDAQEVGSIVRENANDRDEGAIAREVGEHFSPESNERAIRVLNGKGTSVYSSGGDVFPGWNNSSGQNEAFDVTNRAADGQEYLIRTQAVIADSGQKYFVQVAASLSRNQEILEQLLGVLALALLLATAIAVTGGFFLIRSSLRPLDNMAMRAQKITSRSLHERMPISNTGDELQQLSISLNRMIERLEEAFHHISRFSADASHELRTPLTIMRGELETAVQNPKIDAGVRETLGAVLEETVRLSKIVDQLLTMSRLDAGEAFLELSRFDFSELVRTTVEYMRLVTEEKHLVLQVEAGEELQVEGDQSRLQQVIVNLLDNAIKYTPNGGTISVSVRGEGDNAVLTVADTGIGISQEGQAHIFERFYRTDKARSRELGGTGLGLSIVKSIGAAHGGRVSVESAEGRGSTFRFEIPRLVDKKRKSRPIGRQDSRAGKNFQDFSVRRTDMNRKRQLVAVAGVLFILTAALHLFAQAGGGQPGEWQAVDKAIGRSGQVQGDGAYKVGFPRSDLKVTLEGVDLKPALALGGWVAFSKPGPGSMVMGDLVLAEDEVPAVMASLESSGIQVTALHNHVQHESPRVMYMHIGGHGDAVKLASAVKEAMALTKIPAPNPAAGAPADIGIDTAGVEQALGYKGKVNGGVFQVGVPRAESITEGGMKVPNSMGLSTSLNFQPTGGGKAAITGDFVLISTEVNPVIQALRGNGIDVTALHSHMLDEQPTLFFMHFWANDDAVKLAKGLRAALDKTNSQKAK